MPNSTALLEFTVYCFGYITYDQTSELAEDSTMVPQGRLELPRLSTMASKTIVSTIPPPGHKFGSPAWDRTTDTLINSQVQLPLCYWGIFLVREERLELSRLSSLASKTSVATITPLSHYLLLIYGGDEWIRATDLLRMKELHYRCATSPLVLHDGIEPPSPDYKTGIIPVY
jgi:hypothetical protein